MILPFRIELAMTFTSVIPEMACDGALKNALMMRPCAIAAGNIPILRPKARRIVPANEMADGRLPPVKTPSPFWSKSRHADRRPRLAARARVTAALRRHFERRGFIEVEPA